MTPLHNTLSAEQAKEKLRQECIPRQTLSFYKYVSIENPHTLRDQIFAMWHALGVLGRVYVAPEGINAQISLPLSEKQTFQACVHALPGFQDIPFKFALEESSLSFWKLTVKVRKQIVADNLPVDAYDMKQVGKHLNAKTFNEEMEKGAIVIDMRNRYESVIGRFEGAITPSAQTFSDELREVASQLSQKKQEKILLYCTGGIRCEKASAFLKCQGFSDVNQLSGGIIQYAHDVREQGLENKFRGKNFVFDGRMAETVNQEILGTCHTCQQPADTYDNCKSDLCHALFIQCTPCREKTLGTCSPTCQSFAVLPEQERRLARKNRKATFKVLG